MENTKNEILKLLEEAQDDHERKQRRRSEKENDELREKKAKFFLELEKTLDNNESFGAWLLNMVLLILLIKKQHFQQEQKLANTQRMKP